MSDFDYSLFCVLLALCSYGVWWGIKIKRRMYEFPFLVTMIYLVFIVPQVYSLLGDVSLPKFAIAKTILMASLCLMACFLGYSRGGKIDSITRLQLDGSRLLLCSLILTISGSYFYFKLSRLSPEFFVNTMWTGKALIYNFFSNLMSIAFVISTICLIKYRNRYAWVVLLINLGFLFDRIIVAGRRSVAVEVVIIILTVLWFERKIIIPKSVMFSLAAIGFVALGMVSQYRDINLGNEGLRSLIAGATLPSFIDVANLDYKSGISEYLASGEEVRTASIEISATDRLMRFDYGSIHWNNLIHYWVPAQIVGRATKNDLMIEQPDNAFKVYGFRKSVSTATTGLADAFNSFWYFGCLKFFAIGYFVRKIYLRSMYEETMYKIFYLTIITSALHSIPHHTSLIINKSIYVLIFLIPVFIYSKIGIVRKIKEV